MRCIILLSLIMVITAGTGIAGAAGGKRMDVSRKPYGTLADGEKITRYKLTNHNGMSVGIINYGGIVTDLEVPDARGRSGNIVLGCPTLQDYQKHSPYFGCIVGRYANRIARGRFTLNGREYQLATNNGPNHLHGGVRGFDKVVWRAEEFTGDDSAGVRLTHTSPDGEEGYPGTLRVTVTYTINDKNELRIDYDAAGDSTTIVNLSHHSYFNLAGEGKGNVLGHRLQIHAGRYTVVDSTLIPTGELRPVDGTPMDFRTAHAIGERIDAVPGGYDHNYVLDRTGASPEPEARVTEPTTGRVMEVLTTEPGLQFYSGNFLDGTITGRGGSRYPKHAGFCLEAQHFPDSPNHPGFPTVVLEPGDHYRQTTIYRFSVQH